MSKKVHQPLPRPAINAGDKIRTAYKPVQFDITGDTALDVYYDKRMSSEWAVVVMTSIGPKALDSNHFSKA